MSTLSETTLDKIEIEGKTIGLTKPESLEPEKIKKELAHMNARLATREEALEYSRKRAGDVGSQAETRKFDADTLSNEPIVFALRKDWYVLGYLSDVGEDISEIEYQGIIVVTEE